MERERITISIKNNVLKIVDKTIDGINVRNRSHAIETLLIKASEMDSSTKHAVILLGGEDAMKSIPLVQANLKKLSDNGFTKVFIAVGYLADKIKSKLGDGSDFGLTLQYLDKGEGSGGAISSLKKAFDKTFIVLNFTDITKFDLDKLFDLHKQFKTEATIITNDLEGLTGLYILEPSTFSYLPKGFSMLETDIFPKLIADGKLVVRPTI